MDGSVETLDRLRRSALFADLSEPEITALARIVTISKVTKGRLLFMEGDQATGFFLLISGAVRIFKSSPEGREYTLHRVGPGQMFAEAAIFKGDSYPASCMALENSEVARFPKSAFVALVERHPNVALKIMSGLSSLLRDFAQQLEALSLKEVPARLAGYLVRQMKEHGSAEFELPTSKTGLAAELGTIIETLSRSLRRLRDAGVIRSEGRRIRILDVHRLNAIADGDKT